MNLIGRGAELAAVERLLDRAVAGAGGYLVVTGPPGAGRSALAEAAARSARARGIAVVRPTGTGADGSPLWDRLLTAGAGPGGPRTGTDRNPVPAGAHDGFTAGPQAPPAARTRDPDPEDVDRVARAAAAGGPRLLLLDDIDREGESATAFLARLVPHLGTGQTALLATAADSLGLPHELRLRGLRTSELAELTPGLSADAVHAVWLASAGLPGAAIALSRDLAALDADEDPFVHLALTARSRAAFLDIDAGLVRLLEAAAERPLPPATRARVLARLARELLGDPSAGDRRRDLADEALALARTSGSPGLIAEVLDSRLHALWDPAAAHERLATASEIVALARPAGDAVTERRGLFWRFTALVELGDLRAAEAALTAYARAGELSGDAEAAAVVPARQSMLAAVRGRFDVAAALADVVALRGRQAGLADTDRLVGGLHGSIATLRGDWASVLAPWQALARRMPGHFFEATAARALAECARGVEAGLELERLLPVVLAGSGPRWLGAAADLAVVASRFGEPESAQALYDALLPYSGQLVVWGGANTVTGPVDHYLGLLATRLGSLDDAVTRLDRAAALDQRIGALPWLTHTLAARARALTARNTGQDKARAEEDLERARSTARRLGMTGLPDEPALPAGEWRLAQDEAGWQLDAGPEKVRLPAGRGMGYLRTLLAAPGQEIAALDLVAGGSGLRASGGDPLLDDTARSSYRRRLSRLDDLLDAADRDGDVEQAAAVQRERNALVTELRRASGLGGRPRMPSGEAERARVNATRALGTAVRRIEAAAPLAGAHLRASLRTGRYLRYQPAPGGPTRWRV
ncbi:ATP-binding protein [Streptomyces sp. NBC_01476]|uniref:AAA family ATPase n=1 Tax=Streptomyces sp. NBC_01476 TaxID=2903881 RepID=UPI002E36B3F0|nr:AAA family ATPase [Streptomyces sp. NBC_01476]